MTPSPECNLRADGRNWAYHPGVPPPARQRPCRCEPPPDEPLIPEMEYGFWGLLVTFMGVTARPRRVDFLCPRCRQTVAGLRDEAALERFIRGA